MDTYLYCVKALSSEAQRRPSYNVGNYPIGLVEKVDRRKENGLVHDPTQALWLNGDTGMPTSSS
jgi:hypothetical protein